MTAMAKNFDQPDELVRMPGDSGAGSMVNLDGMTVVRGYFEPGWRWSNDVKPIAKTKSSEAPHFQYHVSGRLAFKTDDGTEFIAEPGDVTALPVGHDAWVVGEEPAVVVDWWGASRYAKEKGKTYSVESLVPSHARS